MLPTYNEKDNLEKLVREILSVHKCPDILIIDDSSPDGTGEIADKLSQEFGRVEVMHRPPKSGRGTASLDGFKYAIDRGYDYYLEMDVDFSHDPKELPKLLEAPEEIDMVIASRFAKGGRVVGWSFKRHLLHFAAEVAIKIILGSPCKDNTNGYKRYSVEKLKRVDFSKLPFTGYAAHTILANLFYRDGFKLKEVPSVFVDRQAGKSKNSLKEAWRGIADMMKFRFMCLRRGVKYFLDSGSRPE